MGHFVCVHVCVCVCMYAYVCVSAKPCEGLNCSSSESVGEITAFYCHVINHPETEEDRFSAVNNRLNTHLPWDHVPFRHYS